jgi:hypothetical protein
MTRVKSTRLSVAVVLAAVVIILAAGGVAVASNMGFKLNKPLVANTATSGQNWVAIPMNNPYGTIKNFCTQTGLPSALATTATITAINPVNNLPTTVTCFAAVAQLLPNDCTGIRVSVPPSAGLGSIIIVGSHNPGKTCGIPANTAASGQFWFSVPYHTTAVTLKDLCNQIGMASSLASTGQGTRINATNNLPDTRTCFSGTSTGLNLVLGEAIRLLNPTAIPSFTPAHY